MLAGHERLVCRPFGQLSAWAMLATRPDPAPCWRPGFGAAPAHRYEAIRLHLFDEGRERRACFSPATERGFTPQSFVPDRIRVVAFALSAVAVFTMSTPRTAAAVLSKMRTWAPLPIGAADPRAAVPIVDKQLGRWKKENLNE
jgi:hypothetical protein